MASVRKGFVVKLQNHIEGIEKTPCLGVKSGHGVNNLQGSLLYRGLSN